MKVHLTFHSLDLQMRALSGDIELPAEGTVEQAVNVFLAVQGEALSAEHLRQSVILVNRRSARAEQALQDGDDVMVLRAVAGG